ncbi:MAG TPA: ABC transporter permease, partial [Armatimonadota bacterium]|nr:ABC transporter permease [Armatimonadota bacterium]
MFSAFRPLRRALARPWLLLGSVLAVLILLAALLAPQLAPHNPLREFPQGLTRYGAPAPPAPGHPLGFDSRGRDVLSRILFGARLSLAVGLGAAAVAVCAGLAVGLAAGYFGGAVDNLLMRLTDVVMAFPAVLLALAMGAVLPQRNVWTLVLVIAAVNWTGAARIFRGETLSLRERLYVEAARALGAPTGRILLRHVLPHLLPTMLVVASLGAAA